MLKRNPRAALRPFVRTLWVTQQPSIPRPPAASREHVLPTGDMHIVFRLCNHPLRLYDDVQDSSGCTVGHMVVGGPRATFYLRDISEPAWSVGAQLSAGASDLLFGVPADKLAGRHTPLDLLWGRSAELMRDQLFAARGPEHQLDILESILAARLPRVRGLHPAVAQALERFQTTSDVGAAAKAAGYSHRHFIELFLQGVGLTPRLFCRVLRFQRVLDRVTADQTASWTDLALASGYSDQSHFNREFREFAGVTPGEYREMSPCFPHHVPLRRSIRSPPEGQIRSRQDEGPAPESGRRPSTKGDL